MVNTIASWVWFELTLVFAGKRNRIEVINRCVPRWAAANLWIYGVDVKPRGPLGAEKKPVAGRDEAGRGRIFISNHRSALDIPILLSLVEAHCISRHDLASWPIIGKGAQRIGTLFVNRSSRRSGAAVLKEIAHAVENGEGVAMFPEGTAYAGDEVRPFHTGAFKAAQRSCAELVPIGIAYGNDAAYYTDNSFLEHIKRVASLRRLPVAIEIGPPIAPGCKDTLAVADSARQQIQELVNRARARLQDSQSDTGRPESYR